MKKSTENLKLRVMQIITNVIMLFLLSISLYVIYAEYVSANVINLLSIFYTCLTFVLLIIANLFFSLGYKFINSFEELKNSIVKMKDKN